MTTTINAAIADWLDAIADTRSPETLRTYTYAMRVFETWLARHHPSAQLADLHASLLKSFVADLLKQHLADRTRQQYVDVLCRWLAALVEAGDISGIPNDRGKLLSPVGLRSQLERMLPRREPAVAPRMPDLRRLPAYYAEAITRFLRGRAGIVPSDDDARAHRTYLNLLRNQALITTLFSSGGRVNEVLSIDVTHLVKRGKVTDSVSIQGKGRKKRAIYLNAEAQGALRDYLIARSAAFPNVVPLFISHGPRAAGERLSDISAWRIVKEAGEALANIREVEGADEQEVAALRSVSPHGLRHFFAQSMLDEGADYKDIAGALGHSSTKVTEQVYARQSQDEILEVIATFAARPSKRFDSDTEA